MWPSFANSQQFFSAGRYVVLDLGFCVTRGIVDFKKERVSTGALIQKKRYWPALVPGEDIDKCFKTNSVGKTDTISGKLSEINYFTWEMKELYYAMKLVWTGDTLISKGWKTACQRWTDGNELNVKQFTCTMPFQWHFQYCHIVEDHNNLWHTLPSIEDTWRTDHWSSIFFAFLLLKWRHNWWCDIFVGKLMLMKFQHNWALFLCLLGNWLTTTWSALRLEVQRRLRNQHILLLTPTLTDGWDGRNRIANSQYHEFTFRGATNGKRCTQPKNKMQTYCICSPAKWICNTCHLEHIVELRNDRL